ncbi:phage/plasmid primase, P4 family [Oerskovia sp. NPDC060338]|uniref:phage/plasmid primase, P4 family n=1 Tax=Oerskovia sp. NPDC060338 TaxID=3347100 RepID=UPI003664006B
MTGPDILTTALDLHAHGYSVLPIRPDGSKAPTIPWKPYITDRATENQVRAWFTDTTNGLAAVQGHVSGNAVLIELEGRAAASLPDLAALAHDTGLSDLWARITTGWLEQSPSGGFHFHVRVESHQPVLGNQKLARRPSTPDELAAAPGARVQVLAETRGEGGYVVVAPTPGTHHPSGLPWVRLAGGPATAPVLTVDELEAFLTLVRTLDEAPAPQIPARAESALRDPADGVTPGDDYETRTDWADILLPHGWTLVAARGRTRYWRRPGKTTGLWSASTGHADDRDRLFVFSSSTDFEQEVPYTKLGAYALLEHGGDHAAAARELRRTGFGEQATRLRPVPHGPGRDFDDILGTHGATALQPTPTPAPQLRAVPDPTPRDAEPNQDNTALLLVDAHAHDVRYCAGRGSWLTWNGHRWETDDRELIREHTREIARRLPIGEGWTRYTNSALSASGVSGVVRLAQSDARVVAPIDRLDAHPYELNTPHGIVNLRTGTLSPPDPDRLHTRATTVAPDFTAPHPLWDRFLADTFAGDPEMIAFIARALGLSLVGQVLEQVFFFAFGAGANGKTTMLSVVQHIVGLGNGGYAASAPAEMLLATKNHGHPAELARLSGQRLTVTSELDDGQRFDEARIKQLSGKDTISARFMNRDWFDFTPTHTLWLLANHQPQVRVGGLAFWRRVIMIPFVHTVPEDKRIKDLEERLIAEEGPAILAWCLRGAADYFARGLAVPESVRAATTAYETGQNTVASFVEDCAEIGDPNAQHMKVRSSEVRAAYERWCLDEGVEPVPARSFTLALKSQFGVLSERSMSARYLAGIRLVEASSDASSEASSDGPTAATWFNPEGW